MKLRYSDTIKNFKCSRTSTVYLLLAGITAVGLVLRIYQINFQSLWYDELHSIIPTDPEKSIASIIEYCKIDQPPFFFIYLHYVFKFFGYNEVVGRLASAAVGVASIPVMFLLGKEVRGNVVGLFAALLTSLNYMHIYYSQELRFYSMAFLLTSLSFFFLIRAVLRGRNADYIFYVCSTTALLYTHYYGLVIYCVQVLVFLVLIIFSNDRSFVWKSLISGLLVLLMFLPWVPVVVNDLGIQTFWIRMPGPGFIADYFYYYFGKDALVTITFVFLLYFFLRSNYEQDRPDAKVRILDYVIIMWITFSYLIPYLKSLIGPPVLYVRYTIVSLPAWFLALSIGWDRIRAKKWKYCVAGVISLSMLINIVFIRKHYSKVDKQQFREVSNFIKKNNSSLLPVYSKFAWHFNFYFREDSVAILDIAEADLLGVDRFWLLHAEFFLSNEKDELIDAFADRFQVAEQHDFYKTSAVLMSRKK